MKRGEAARWLAALAGLLFWFGIVWVFAAGGLAEHAYRCRGRVDTGRFDDCFNDALPVLEIFAVPLFILATAYAFARFAFSLYAPPPAARTRRWRLASRDGAGASWPVFPLLGLIGTAWALWRLSTYPLDPALLPFHLYWAAFAAWFAAGALIAHVEGRPERGDS